jgi:uncharacterized protein (TIGR00255 family)
MPKQTPRSMTGYGEAASTVDGVHYYVEIRSLNNRYFKSTVRLPEEFAGLEAEFESKLREKITRGTVTVNVRCTDSSSNAAYEINTPALARYIEQLRAMPQLANEKLDIVSMLHLPGVLQSPTAEEDRLDKARVNFMPLLEKACGSLIGMREREGETIIADLRDQLGFIGSRLAEVRGLAPGVIADYELRLKSRIDTLVRESQAHVNPGDLIREIAAYAERTDIAEEIKRLTAHLAQCEEMLSGMSGKPIGRTLDFLAQEMLREANTIASKSPDAAISRCSIDMKGAIDRIKEQVQNLE